MGARGEARLRGALVVLGALGLGGCARREVTVVEVPVERRMLLSPPEPGRYTVVVVPAADPAAVGVFSMQRCTWLADERWQTVRTEERPVRTWLVVMGGILAAAGVGAATDESDPEVGAVLLLGGALMVTLPLTTAGTEVERGEVRRVVTPRGAAPCRYEPQRGRQVQALVAGAPEVRLTDEHGTARFSGPVMPAGLLVDGRAPDGLVPR